MATGDAILRQAAHEGLRYTRRFMDADGSRSVRVSAVRHVILAAGVGVLGLLLTFIVTIASAAWELRAIAAGTAALIVQALVLTRGLGEGSYVPWTMTWGVGHWASAPR